MVSADHEGLEATALADDEFIIPTYKDIGAQVPEEIVVQLVSDVPTYVVIHWALWPSGRGSWFNKNCAYGQRGL